MSIFHVLRLTLSFAFIWQVLICNPIFACDAAWFLPLSIYIAPIYYHFELHDPTFFFTAIAKLSISWPTLRFAHRFSYNLQWLAWMTMGLAMIITFTIVSDAIGWSSFVFVSAIWGRHLATRCILSFYCYYKQKSQKKQVQ